MNKWRKSHQHKRPHTHTPDNWCGGAHVTLCAAADVVPADLCEFLCLPAGGVGATAAMICNQQRRVSRTRGSSNHEITLEPSLEGSPAPSAECCPTWAVVLVDGD